MFCPYLSSYHKPVSIFVIKIPDLFRIYFRILLYFSLKHSFYKGHLFKCLNFFLNFLVPLQSILYCILINELLLNKLIEKLLFPLFCLKISPCPFRHAINFINKFFLCYHCSINFCKNRTTGCPFWRTPNNKQPAYQNQNP